MGEIVAGTQRLRLESTIDPLQMVTTLAGKYLLFRVIVTKRFAGSRNALPRRNVRDAVVPP